MEIDKNDVSPNLKKALEYMLTFDFDYLTLQLEKHITIPLEEKNKDKKEGENIPAYWRRGGVREYDLLALYMWQGGKCYICEREIKFFVRGRGNDGYVCLDHDHNCCPKKSRCPKCIRSLLCHKCNTGLGYFKDDIELLKRAIELLKDWKENTNFEDY